MKTYLMLAVALAFAGVVALWQYERAEKEQAVAAAAVFQAGYESQLKTAITLKNELAIQDGVLASVEGEKARLAREAQSANRRVMELSNEPDTKTIFDIRFPDDVVELWRNRPGSTNGNTGIEATNDAAAALPGA